MLSFLSIRLCCYYLFIIAIFILCLDTRYLLLRLFVFLVI